VAWRLFRSQLPAQLPTLDETSEDGSRQAGSLDGEAILAHARTAVAAGATPCAMFNPKGPPALPVDGPFTVMERTDMSAGNPLTCPCCAGLGVPLGTLGRQHWFRCRDYGMPFGSAKRARRAPESPSHAEKLHRGNSPVEKPCAGRPSCWHPCRLCI
jgi:hypothetical protein